jgi:hypothetical protein
MGRRGVRGKEGRRAGVLQVRLGACGVFCSWGRMSPSPVTVTERLERWGCREEERCLRWKEREGMKQLILVLL